MAFLGGTITQNFLKWDSVSSSLKEMSDTDLENLSYFTRKRFALELVDCINSNGGASPTALKAVGLISITQHDSSYLSIGTAEDNFSGATISTTSNNNTPPSEFPLSYPTSVTEQTPTTHTFYQKKSNLPPWPNYFEVDNSNSLLFASYQRGYSIYNKDRKRIEVQGSDESLIFTNVLDDCTQHMFSNILSADEVGTFRIGGSSSSTMTTLYGGTWVDCGNWFLDDYFDTSNLTSNLSNPPNTDQITWKLWLKTAKTTEPSDEVRSIYGDGDSVSGFTGLKSDNSTTSNPGVLVQNVFLPALRRKFPVYQITEGNSPANNTTVFERGAFTDTKLDSNATGSFLGGNNVYTAYRYPQGANETQATYWLSITGYNT